MDRIKLVYSSDSEEDLELPFRILIIGDFTLGVESSELIAREPMSVTVTNLDAVIASMGIRIRERLPDCLLEEENTVLDIDIPIDSLNSFHPDSVIESVPEMRQLLILKKTLLNARRDGKADEDIFEQHRTIPGKLWRELGFKEDLVDIDLVNVAIAEINRKLNNQLNTILHCKSFKKLESIWRSVFYLVKQNISGENCEIDILSTTPTELLEDFQNCGEVFDSFLYKTVYLEELGMYGGRPYSVMISDFCFDKSVSSLELLQGCSDVARLSYAPFIAGVSPQLLGIENLGQLATLKDLGEVLNRDQKFIKWREFRYSESARFVGLTVPGFLLRTAYDYKKDALQKFAFEEHEDYLWGSGSFAFASCMMRSFIRYRWYLNIIGSEGGRVPDISWTESNAIGEEQPLLPLPVFISENNYVQLSKNGFIPLFYHSDWNAVAFHSANSVRAYATEDEVEDKNVLDKRLSNQLPYLYIVCRLAHYLKVIQRSNIGSPKTQQQLEDELNSWLVQYVSEMDNPTPEVQARRPLRRASVKILNKEQAESELEMKLEITPHFKYMGSAFSLSLQGHL